MNLHLITCTKTHTSYDVELMQNTFLVCILNARYVSIPVIDDNDDDNNNDGNFYSQIIAVTLFLCYGFLLTCIDNFSCSLSVCDLEEPELVEVTIVEAILCRRN